MVDDCVVECHIENLKWKSFWNDFDGTHARNYRSDKIEVGEAY